jgi:hypothetical protein
MHLLIMWKELFSAQILKCTKALGAITGAVFQAPIERLLTRVDFEPESVLWYANFLRLAVRS